MLGAILDVGIWILELRNSVYYNIDRAQRLHKSKIRNLKSQIIIIDSIFNNNCAVTILTISNLTIIGYQRPAQGFNEIRIGKIIKNTIIRTPVVIHSPDENIEHPAEIIPI